MNATKNTAKDTAKNTAKNTAKDTAKDTAPAVAKAEAVITSSAPAPAVSDRQAKKDAFRAGQETVRAIQGELLAMRKSGETVLSTNSAEMIITSMLTPTIKTWEGKGYAAKQTKGQLAPIGEDATPTAWERGAACELNRMLAPLHGFGVRIVRYTSDKGTTYSGWVTLLGR